MNGIDLTGMFHQDVVKTLQEVIHIMVHPFILFFSFFFIKLNVKAKKAILSLLLSLPTNLSNVEIIF